MSTIRKRLLFILLIIIGIAAASTYSFKQFMHPAAHNVTTIVLLEIANGPACGGSTVVEINGQMQSDTICFEFTDTDARVLSPSGAIPLGKYKITGKAFITTERLEGGTGIKYPVKVMHFIKVDQAEKLSSS
jgi:hypothetical protein